MSHDNKYTLQNATSTKKEIAETFFSAGFYIKPYHTVVNGVCTCKAGKLCTTPGKHPLFNKSGACYNLKSFEKVLAYNPDVSIGLCTGYSKINELELCIIDFDTKDQAIIDLVAGIIPSMKNTFTLETAKGFHFYLFAPKFSFIGTTLKFKGLPVDILCSHTRGALSLGSPNKTLLNPAPIELMSAIEAAALRNNTYTSAKTNKAPKKVWSYKEEGFIDLSKLEESFLSGQVERGGYHLALRNHSLRHLRMNGAAIAKGEYTLEMHVDYMIQKAVKLLKNPTIEVVAKQAADNFLRFNTGDVKTRHPAVIFDEVFKGLEPELKAHLRLIFQYGFITSSDSMKEEKTNCAGTSLIDLKKSVYEHLKALDLRTNFVFTDKQFVIFLSEFHNLNKISLDKIVDGKRVQKRVWNIAAVSHSVFLDTVASESIKEEKTNCAGTNVVPEHKTEKKSINTKTKTKRVAPTQPATITSTVKPSSASTVRPNIKDEPVDAKEIEEVIKAPIIFMDNLEEKFKDLLFFN